MYSIIETAKANKLNSQKLNDRPKDSFSGESGNDMSVPERKDNNEEINHESGKEGI